MSLTGLRERKKAQTREAIVETAVELFLARGYDETTVEDIAAAVDVSPRTFFRYFPTKDEVLFAEADTTRAAFRDLLDARPADESVFEALRATAIEVLESEDVDTDRTGAVMRLINSHPSLQARYLELLHVIEDDVAEWAAVRLGDSTNGLRPRLVAAAVMSARRAAFEAWLADDDPDASFKASMLDAMDLLAAGLRQL